MIVLVGGLPGSGKTYFAERLASRIGAGYISSDQVRMALRATGKYDIGDKLYVYRELVGRAESECADKKTVVIDATFSHEAMRAFFVSLASKLDIAFRMIWVFADEKLIKERTSKPRKHTEADFGVYLKIRDQFQPITFPVLELESTNDNIDGMLKAGVDYLFSK